MATIRPKPHAAIVVILIAIIVMAIGLTTWVLTTKHKVVIEKQARADSVKVAEEKEAAVRSGMYYAPPVEGTLDFPAKGEGHATKKVGLRAWLNPMKTHTRPSREVRYVFAEDTTIFFDDTAGADETKYHLIERKWWRMPAGKYIVYPLRSDDVFFRWW
jgi:hypothetical protein